MFDKSGRKQKSHLPQNLALGNPSHFLDALIPPARGARSIFWPPVNAPASGSPQPLTTWLCPPSYPALTPLPSSMSPQPNQPTPNHPPLLQPDPTYHTLAIAPTVSPRNSWWLKSTARVYFSTSDTLWHWKWETSPTSLTPPLPHSSFCGVL